MLRDKLRGRGSSDATSCFQRSCLANDLLSDLPGIGVGRSARQIIVPAVEKPVADSWSLETCQSGATTSTSPSSSCNLARPRFLPSRSLAVKIYLGISDSGKPIARIVQVFHGGHGAASADSDEWFPGQGRHIPIREGKATGAPRHSAIQYKLSAESRAKRNAHTFASEIRPGELRKRCRFFLLFRFQVAKCCSCFMHQRYVARTQSKRCHDRQNLYTRRQAASSYDSYPVLFSQMISCRHVLTRHRWPLAFLFKWKRS